MKHAISQRATLWLITAIVCTSTAVSISGCKRASEGEHPQTESASDSDTGNRLKAMASAVSPAISPVTPRENPPHANSSP